MISRPGVLLSSILVLTACGGDGPTEPPPTGAPVALVVAPAALLFGAAGEQQQLQAYLIDADGTRTEVDAEFTSSNQAVAAVGAGGIATGGTSIGSAQIVATSAGLTSVPVFALRATPAAGALLVADSQVVSDPEPLDSFAAYGLGWQERVQLRNVRPTPGQLIIASGGAPIAGRVVAVEPGQGGASVVSYELIALPDLFQDLRIQERIPLTRAAPASVGGASSSRRGSGSMFPAPALPERRPTAANAASGRSAPIEREFTAGPFECKGEVPANLVTVPFSLTDYSADPRADLDMELEYDRSSGRFAAGITGTLGADLAGKPRLTLAVEAKVGCEWELIPLYVPIGGALSRFFGFVVPVGLGFELGGKISENGVGVDFTSQPSVQVQLGIRCEGACVTDFDITGQAPGTLKPVFPSLSDAGEITLGAAGFIYANLVFGAHLRPRSGGGFSYRRLEVKLLETKAGLKQEASLATRSAQSADPAYASSVTLSGFAEAGTSPSVDALMQLLRVSLPQLKKEWTFGPEARSPRGTFSITPATVAAGDGIQLGEMATFTVNLTDVTYLGAYAVEGIEIRWLRTNGAVVTLEPGRPGCTDLAATQDQVSFGCQADFLEAHEGPQTFYAFAKTRIFGVSLPVPLEIGPDAKATVTVGGDSPDRVALDVVKGYGPGTEAGVGGLSCSKNWDTFETPVSPSLSDEKTSTCSASGVDPGTGAALSAEMTGVSSYTAFTSTGTTSGNLSSIQLGAELAGRVNGASLQAQAGSRGRTEMCFMVAAGGSLGWQISGTVQAGNRGRIQVELSGSGVPRQEIVGVDGGSQAIGLSGRLEEGSYCMELYYELILETSPELASLEQSLHATAILTFLP